MGVWAQPGALAVSRHMHACIKNSGLAGFDHDDLACHRMSITCQVHLPCAYKWQSTMGQSAVACPPTPHGCAIDKCVAIL